MSQQDLYGLFHVTWLLYENTTTSLNGSWSKVTCTYKTKPLRQEYIFSDKPYQVCVFAFS